MTCWRKASAVPSCGNCSRCKARVRTTVKQLTDTHVDFWTTPDSSGRNLGSLDDDSFLKELESSYVHPMDLTGQLAPPTYHAATKTNHLKSPSSGGSITHRATLRRRHRTNEVRRLKEILRRHSILIHPSTTTTTILMSLLATMTSTAKYADGNMAMFGLQMSRLGLVTTSWKTLCSSAMMMRLLTQE